MLNLSMDLKKRILELPKNRFLMLALIFIVVSLVLVFAGNIVFRQGSLTVEGGLDLRTAGPDVSIISTTPAAATNTNDIFFRLLSNTQEREFGKMEVMSSVITDASREGTINFLTASGGNPAIRLSIKGSNVGIGTTSPQRILHIGDVMRLEPRATAPTGASSGDLYVDSTPASDELCFYDGNAWQGISSGIDANCA